MPDRRVKYTLLALRGSLLELMREKDVSRITVKELCERADVNRGTFYAHYASPADLLEQIEQELLEKVARLAGIQACHGLAGRAAHGHFHHAPAKWGFVRGAIQRTWATRNSWAA